MPRSLIPGTTHAPARALLHCLVCQRVHRKNLPDISPEDGWEDFVWKMNDLWPRCCGADLNLLEMIDSRGLASA